MEMNCKQAVRRQVSDSIPCGILLSLSGGCMDAYSYLFRGEVFANAQTGNMLLFGVYLANREISYALNHLWPVLAFTGGIILSEIINAKKSFIKLHWRQISVIIEIVILTMVAFFSKEADALANILISFACGIQVESFRKIHGNAIATTMCIGNLRSGTYNLDKYFNTHDKEYLKKACIYYGIIVSFVIGAIIESMLLRSFGSCAIFFSTAMLLGALIIMFKSENPDDGDTFIEG